METTCPRIKRKPLSEEAKQHLSRIFKGRIFSKETKAKISKSLQGKKMSEQTKAKLRQFNLENNIRPPSRLGTKHSPEQRSKFRQAMLGHTVAPETRLKISLAQKGSLANNWKGGITPENLLIRHSPQYKEWRESVFKRDNWTCSICLIKGGKLNADHIKPFAKHPERRFDVDNGRTLCAECHRKTPTYGGRTR